MTVPKDSFDILGRHPARNMQGAQVALKKTEGDLVFLLFTGHVLSKNLASLKALEFANSQSYPARVAFLNALAEVATAQGYEVAITNDVFPQKLTVKR